MGGTKSVIYINFAKLGQFLCKIGIVLGLLVMEAQVSTGLPDLFQPSSLLALSPITSSAILHPCQEALPISWLQALS